jgi:flagellar hook-associated protein 1 FlgK
MDDPAKVAAAAAVRADVEPDNTGDASIEAVRAVDASDPDLQVTVNVTFDGGAGEFDVNGNTVALDPSGVTTIAANGWELVVRGTPADGDEFTVRSNAGQPGDNRNMLAMADLSSEQVVEGNRSVAEGYNSLLGEVGTRTRQAQVSRDSTAAQLDQARAQRESVSGVNLDEEAADLIRFQQAYQAAAQVISVNNSLFDSLLGAFR